MGDLDGKTALVTGGGKGIGRAISQALGAKGAKVIVNYRADAAAAAETVASIPGALSHQADVSEPAQVEAMFKAIGKVDVLVNNAGLVRDKLLLQMSPPDWEDVIRTDLLSVFATTQLAVRSMMRSRWGRIVNISSIVGITGNAGQSNYAAAKAGLIGFTKSVARELGAFTITANVVAPGLIETDMVKAMPDEAKAKSLAEIVLGKLGEPEDVAAAVTILAGPSAKHITGVVLQVDGGQYL